MVRLVEIELYSNNNYLSYSTNPLLGPHQDRELELMLRGTKPAALINEIETDNIKEFEKQVIAGTIKYVMKISTTKSNDISLLYTLPGQEYRAEKIKEVYDDVIQTNKMTNKHHIALGKLLGYSDREIDEFVRIKR